MKKNILAIIGSASKNSSNLKLVQRIADLTQDDFDITIFDRLSSLPHFDPDLSVGDTPEIISDFRQLIQRSNGVIICTPEYIFSIPGSLKNAIEWCVATTVFSKKPARLITASASGEKGQEELKLIMRTIEAIFTDDTTLLIKGIKGKITEGGNINDDKTSEQLMAFITAFKKLVKDNSQ
ncbi:MAG TPA: NADPH-dependent FMN reductase [Parafilimonas sp.]|nr:NADPH-dependent FMN reductase [Parafilimonas sp.]